MPVAFAYTSLIVVMSLSSYGPRRDPCAILNPESTPTPSPSQWSAMNTSATYPAGIVVGRMSTAIPCAFSSVAMRSAMSIVTSTSVMPAQLVPVWNWMRVPYSFGTSSVCQWPIWMPTRRWPARSTLGFGMRTSPCCTIAPPGGARAMGGAERSISGGSSGSGSTAMGSGPSAGTGTPAARGSWAIASTGTAPRETATAAPTVRIATTKASARSIREKGRGLRGDRDREECRCRGDHVGQQRLRADDVRFGAGVFVQHASVDPVVHESRSTVIHRARSGVSSVEPGTGLPREIAEDGLAGRGLQLLEGIDRRRDAVGLHGRQVECARNDRREVRKCARSRDRDEIAAVEQRARLREHALLDLGPQMRLGLVRVVQQHGPPPGPRELVPPSLEMSPQLRHRADAQQLPGPVGMD